MLGYLPDRLLMFDFSLPIGYYFLIKMTAIGYLPDRLLLFKFDLPDRTLPKILRKNSKSTKYLEKNLKKILSPQKYLEKNFYKITDFIKFIKYVTDF